MTTPKSKKKKAKAQSVKSKIKKSSSASGKDSRKKSVVKSATGGTAKANKKTAPSAKKAASKGTAQGKKSTAKPKGNSKAKRGPDGAPATNRKPSQRGETQTKSMEARRRVSKAKILPKDFLTELANTIRSAVVPAMEASKGRDVVGTSTSGDATFELDKIAEKALLMFLKNAKMPVAYYSEDSGYTTFTSSQPTNLLVVDPIDGTRAAKCGFEACVVSVCSTRVIERPTLGDVDNGIVLELVGNRVFYAERGRGARLLVKGHARKIRLSENDNLETMAWSMTVPARPAELIFPTAARLIDLTSLKGGFFACNSTSFSLTRLISNQLDACVDFANRFYRDIPSVVEDYFINAGRGTVLGVCPYDMGAALLVAKEAGCIVTDAYGESLEDVLLLDSSVSNQRSVIAAANPELHKTLMKFFETRITQFESLLSRRASNN